jgi:hypothetical protein
MTILDEIIAFKQAPNGLKDRSVAYINDMTVPLSVRWAVFKEMSDDWKVEESWIQHFDAEKLLPCGEISWYDDFYVEKYETVDMVEFVEERLIEKLFEESDEDYPDEVYGATIDTLPPEIQTIVDAWREEILSKNLASFTYDW